MISADSALYRDLMRFKPEGWTANAWAVNAGVSRTVWTDMRRHGNPSRRTLEKLLAAAGSSLAEFEALRIGETQLPADGVGSALADPSARGWRPAALSSPLPLLASSAGVPVEIDGKRVEATELSRGTVERVPRPPTLAGDSRAYALTVVGDAMWPRFRPGRRIAVSPAAPVAPGDDVAVTLSSDPISGQSVVVIAELIDRSGSEIGLRQFNPDVTYRLLATDVRAIHRVLGELI